MNFCKILLALVILNFTSTFSQNNSSVVHFLPTETEAIKNIRDCAISPNGNELYFTHQDPDFTYSVIYRMFKENSVWSKPVKVFSCKKSMNMEPAFSPDGNCLYFVSNRAWNDTKVTDFDIWYVERKSMYEAWSDPIHPDAPFNSSANEFYPSVDSSGNLYFTSDREGTKGKDDIFCASFNGSIYQPAYSLSDSINTNDTEYNACISPDGSFMIFGAYKRPDGFGSGDLYVSFALGNGNWSKAINLGSIVNSDLMDYCPFADLKNGILYFTSKRETGEISYDQKALKEQAKYPGGRSRLFYIRLADIPIFKRS